MLYYRYDVNKKKMSDCILSFIYTAHTHVCFAILVGTSIGIMVFVLYRPYILLPYTNPTPKLSPHRRLFAFLHFKINFI